VRPVGIAVDREGNLYIAHGRALRVRKVSRDGIISTVAGGGTQPVTDGAQATAVALAVPFSMAVDAEGNLFIGDTGLNRILKVTPAGTLHTVAGTGKAGFSGDGGPATAAEIREPRGIGLDRDGNLFFTDRFNRRVRKVSADGIISTVAGSGSPDQDAYAGDGGPATAARLGGAFGLAIDPAGNVYFSDQSNWRIRKIVGIAAPGVIAGR
jgi:sugar lactone lactonase YvrE